MILTGVKAGTTTIRLDLVPSEVEAVFPEVVVRSEAAVPQGVGEP